MPTNGLTRPFSDTPDIPGEGGYESDNARATNRTAFSCAITWYAPFQVSLKRVSVHRGGGHCPGSSSVTHSVTEAGETSRSKDR